MEKIKFYIMKYQKYFIVLIVLILFILQSIFIYYYVNKKTKDKTIVNNIVETKEDEIVTEEEKYIMIDIKGYVKKNGVYKLKEGSRVNDAIEASGGLKKGANTRYINLSKKLNDGDVIVIYSNDEIKEAKKTNTIVNEIPCVCEEIKNDACYNENNNDSDTTLININTATKEQLMTLSGIGESKAESIIEYREKNGNFNNIEDIINVSGISNTLFEKIKEYITI